MKCNGRTRLVLIEDDEIKTSYRKKYTTLYVFLSQRNIGSIKHNSYSSKQFLSIQPHPIKKLIWVNDIVITEKVKKELFQTITRNYFWFRNNIFRQAVANLIHLSASLIKSWFKTWDPEYFYLVILHTYWIVYIRPGYHTGMMKPNGPDALKHIFRTPERNSELSK